MLPLSHNAQEYVQSEILRRIGTPEGSIRFPKIRYGDPDQIRAGDADIIVVPCANDAIESLLGLPLNALDRVSVPSVLPDGSNSRLKGPLPVLLWGNHRDAARNPFVERREDGAVVFNADIFAGSFFLLSRWEEYVSKVRDQHDRFPATASVAFRQGFLDRPLVDEYALIFGEWLQTLAPRWQMSPGKPTVQLSHDIDAVVQTGSFGAGLRRAFDLTVKQGRLGAAAQTLAQIAGLSGDPYTAGIFRLASLSQQYHFPSVFNFMSAAPGPWDSGYDLSEPLVRRIIHELGEAGFEIGFHPSYETLNDTILLEKEMKAFEAVVGSSRHGGRQHYLRFSTPSTWHHWESVGLAYDSTVGYADHEGFRAGTCWRFQPFDVYLDKRIDLWENPLIVMDATLHHYRGLKPEEGKKRILDLAGRALDVGGTFTLLWHNSSFNDSWKPWGKMYCEVLRDLSDLISGRTTWEADSARLPEREIEN